jgi:hypothetical protein
MRGKMLPTAFQQCLLADARHITIGVVFDANVMGAWTATGLLVWKRRTLEAGRRRHHHGVGVWPAVDRVRARLARMRTRYPALGPGLPTIFWCSCSEPDQLPHGCIGGLRRRGACAGELGTPRSLC